MTDMAQADRTLRQSNSAPFDRHAALVRLERENAALRNVLRRLLSEADALTIATGGVPGMTDRWPVAAVARACLGGRA